MQVCAATFFIADVVADLVGLGGAIDGLVHNLLEAAAVMVLIVGIFLTASEMRRIKSRHRRIEAQLRIAAGAFHDLLQEHFEIWGLTPSERDVALLAIKGLSIAEIANARETKDGTIKAQCNAIYTKAGVSGRQQLLSLFIEELMGDGLVQSEQANR